MQKETRIGKVVQYFTNIGVAVINLIDGSLSVGDSIHVMGPNTDLSQMVEEMQINKENVEKVEMGKEVAVKMDDAVIIGDEVYIVTMKE